MSGPRNSRKVALVALLTSISVVLNLIIAVPAPYAGFLFYEIWEVPVVFALLLLGFWGGASVAALNSLVLEAVRPGALPTGPLYNFIAELAMFIGVMAALSVGTRYKWKLGVVTTAATGASIITRTAVMTLVNAVVLPLPYPVGFSLPEASVPGFLVLIAIFNATVTLYTVPLSFSLRKAVSGRLLGLSASAPAQAAG